MSHRRGQSGRPHSRGVHNMLSMLDRLEAIKESVQLYNGELNNEICDLIGGLQDLNEQYVRLGLCIVFAYAYLRPVQQVWANTLWREEIPHIGHWGTFLGVGRLTRRVNGGPIATQ